MASGAAAQQAFEVRDVARGRNGMVVTVSRPATEVGVEVLKKGGNAVDAAVAVALAMAVAYPPAGNIGGGGFMMVYPGGGAEPVCIEYRETAPAAATREMFDLKESKLGHKVVGVPGTVRGLALAHQRFGKLPWKELVLPAARLAEEGFGIDAPLAASLNKHLSDEPAARFAEFRRVFAPPGTGDAAAMNGGRNEKASAAKWKAGDRLVQPELAATLRLLADEGPDAFYTGKIADQIAAEMRSGGGLVTKADLAAYHANVRQPIHGTFRGYDVYGPPPPSSGGIALVEMLNILENFDLKKRGPDSPETVHLMIEAMRRAYLDRARHLGDPDFTRIPPHLLTKEYAKRLASHIDPSRAAKSEGLAPEIAIADEGQSTTHFSVIDKEGLAVANTYTLEHSYGSRVVVRGAGFLLNNEMGDFNWKPGHTDRSGNIGTEANVVAPGKRMLSSQTPTIVAKGGRALLVTGSPGGRTIINTTLAVVLNVLEFEMPPEKAVAAPRWHHQWLPDVVKFEGAARKEFAPLLDDLRRRGHTIDAKGEKQGDAHTIYVDPQTGEYVGVADPRISGRAGGF
ncbi:MAG: gamma-glutamyltransferase [Planctomycetia bacterium]|nr:gamma-glutamyltransferase [Planctomycetia bacterium]